MKYRYYFCNRHNEELVKYLDRNEITYTLTEEMAMSRWVIFNLWSTMEHVEEHLQELKKYTFGSPLVFAEYTSSEYKNAKLLEMRAKRQIVDVINGEEVCSYSCMVNTILGERRPYHETQVGIYKIAKEPSTKTSRAFWHESTGFADLFTDYRVKELAELNMLIDVEFKNVILRNGDFSDKIFQMTSKNILSRGSIVLGYGEEKHVCPICGKEQYFIDNTYQVHLKRSELKRQSDLYMTERMWGEGIAYPVYIISQRFYQLLKKNKLASGAEYIPVIDVD